MHAQRQICIKQILPGDDDEYKTKISTIQNQTNSTHTYAYEINVILKINKYMLAIYLE